MRVELGERSYDIYIGDRWLPRLTELLSFIPQESKMIMITDQNVSALYESKALEVLRSAGYKVEAAVIPGGESCKNLNTVAGLYEQMIDQGLDRKSTVLALGGGIVGDIAGFAAATYMRGVGYIQIPTTVLAQVDSSVGGKTGVNLSRGKNLVGSFYQPELVFVDVAFIDTLPEREYLTGLAEVIKYGIIWDKDFFKYLEDNMDKIKSRDSDCLIHIVTRCCEIKAEIVSMDEKENGLRALLNLGHTFGHAFEAMTNYEKFTHGEAVAVGTIYASRLARHLDLLSSSDLQRITNLIKGYGLPVAFGELDIEEVVVQMRKDKKSVGGKIQVVLPKAIGSSQMFNNMNESELAMILTSNISA